MRWLAVFTLMILAPVIAEYLVGSMSVAMLPILPVMILMYGMGAVLIRDIVRRAGKGWPSLILLATAYGFIEEGLVTQSLFNPNYLHLRLLDFGFIPALGTSPVWAIYVLGLHMFWSIPVPVGLAESLFPARRTMPWLGPVSLGMVGVLFLAGLGLVAVFTHKMSSFMASPAQLVSVLIIIAGLVAAALAWPKPGAPDPRPNPQQAPHPVILFLVGLVPGSLFIASEFYGARLLHLTWPEVAALLAGCEILALGLMVVLTRNRIWTNARRFALMAGALSVYVWCGFPTDADLHGCGDLPGHTVLVAIVLAVTIFAGFQAVRFKETR